MIDITNGYFRTGIESPLCLLMNRSPLKPQLYLFVSVLDYDSTFNFYIHTNSISSLYVLAHYYNNPEIQALTLNSYPKIADPQDTRGALQAGAVSLYLDYFVTRLWRVSFQELVNHSHILRIYNMISKEPTECRILAIPVDYAYLSLDLRQWNFSLQCQAMLTLIATEVLRATKPLDLLLGS
ncbi:hypothetical protein VNO77_15008 [Canavalia gladiata]|uniref:Uncharacterized protein n=1 Tax=Canavalia gladiata TaxID=3824 RepID=A0AAN9QNZ8_CANGL